MLTERLQTNVVQQMELYKRAGDESVRDAMASKYFDLRDLDYKVKMLQLKISYHKHETTQDFIQLFQKLKTMLADLAAMCTDLGLCPAKTDPKKLPFNYGQEPADASWGQRLFFMTVPREQELDLMIHAQIERIRAQIE